jgi:hypothetical protein
MPSLPWVHGNANNGAADGLAGVFDDSSAAMLPRDLGEPYVLRTAAPLCNLSLQYLLSPTLFRAPLPPQNH